MYGCETCAEMPRRLAKGEAGWSAHSYYSCPRSQFVPWGSALEQVEGCERFTNMGMRQFDQKQVHEDYITIPAVNFSSNLCCSPSSNPL